MSERASKVNKLSEHSQENSTSKEDSEIDQVEVRASIHIVDTSLQLTTSIIETDSCIELTSRTGGSEISILSTVPMDDSNISVQLTGSTVNVAQLIASIITTNSSVHLASRINAADISVQPTTSMNDADISIEATTLLNEADIPVQPTTPINGEDNPVKPTTRLNEEGTSVQQTAPMSEAEMSTQSTTPMNDADISVKEDTSMSTSAIFVQPTASMSKAAISVQPTASMSEAGISVQTTHPFNVEDLTARINEVRISVQSTVPMTVAIIPGQFSASMHDANSFVESIHEADPNAQPTDQINEAGPNAQPTDRINEADTSVQPTEQINEAGPNAQPTDQINEADPNAQSTDQIKEADTTVQPTEQISEVDLSSTEEYQEAFRIFQWIEVKLDLLKIVQGNDGNDNNNAQNEHRDMSLNEKSTLLERMLEEISQQMTSTNIAEKDDYFSKEVTRMLNMLEETTLEVLDSVKVAKNKRTSFKVLAILMKHLSANIGSEVKLHDVQTFIDGPRVMKLFTDVQIAREPRYLKMSVVKSNLELGIRRAQYVKRKSRWYKSNAEWTDSECARTVDAHRANQLLKTLAEESEKVLLKYKESVKFVLTKAKVFMTLKTDNEDVLGYFLTTEIHDMYKKDI